MFIYVYFGCFPLTTTNSKNRLNHYFSHILILKTYYSWLSLSQLPLKSGPCFNMKIEQQVAKYCGKEEKLLLRIYMIYIYLKSQITHSFVKCGCTIYFFLNSANLICQEGLEKLKLANRSSNFQPHLQSLQLFLLAFTNFTKWRFQYFLWPLLKNFHIAMFKQKQMLIYC